MFIDGLHMQAFYLYGGRVLTKALDGHTEPIDPQPILVRAYYVSPTVDLQKAWPEILRTLNEQKPKHLLYFVPSPDGPPYRMARLYYHAGEEGVSVRGVAAQSISLPIFYPAGPEGQPWDEDAKRSGPGIFITGNGAPSSIWKIHRIERDALRHPLLSLFPVQLAAGFPMLDLSSIEDSSRRQEIASQYDELQRCVLTHAYRGAITRAKDIAEALVTVKADLSSDAPFNKKLSQIYNRLEKGQNQISWLCFTLCQKLRLLHKRTHPDNTIEEGRPVSPELALSAVQDLIEILRDLGCVSESPLFTGLAHN